MARDEDEGEGFEDEDAAGVNMRGRPGQGEEEVSEARCGCDEGVSRVLRGRGSDLVVDEACESGGQRCTAATSSRQRDGTHA